ncbi:MAG: hypothetical protein M1371_09275 [Actinobacteria bacterium]|nr:hypothetical protein [Actinomycetota bacterium]
MAKRGAWLTIGDRIGNIIGAVLSALIIYFFFLHESRETGFFTAAFQGNIRNYFFAMLWVGVGVSLFTAVIGHRNTSRFLQAGSAFFSAWVLWQLYKIFPFDFSHLTDFMWSWAKIVFIWINNPIARIIILVALIISAISAIATFIVFLVHLFRKE